MKQFGNPLILRGPPFELTPQFLINFFMSPLFVQISEVRKPPNFRGGGGNYVQLNQLTHGLLNVYF